MAKIVFLLVAAFACGITIVNSRPVKRQESNTIPTDLEFLGIAARMSANVGRLREHNNYSYHYY